MKLNSRLLFFLIAFFPLIAFTQNDFKKGIVITTDNEKFEASLKLSKGRLIIISAGNRKKIYEPHDIKSFTADTANYISYANDFYEVKVAGEKATLYQKLTDNRNEKIYNGTEIVGFVKTTEGRPGDFYLLVATESKLELITKKSFSSYFINRYNGNDAVISKIKNGELKYEQIEELIEFINKN